MKKSNQREQDMRAEYDFSGGVRGKYAKKFQAGTNIVRIEPDLFREFPNEKSVNRALKDYLKLKKA